MDKNSLSILFLRIGIAFSLIYAAVGGILNPDSWIGFFPPFIQGIVSDDMLLSFWGAIELIIALWLLSNRRVFYPAIISALMMLGIVVFNFGALDVIFRDIAILLAAVSLAIMTYEGKKR
jgi:hypothetical protein